MKTKTINIYSFEELTPEVQKKVLNRFRNDGTFNDEQFLKEDMEYVLSEELKKAEIKAITEPKIYYSLSYSQGDGAMFIGIFEWKGWTVEVKNVGHYCHERSTSFNWTNENEDLEMTAELEEEFEEKVYIPICLALKKHGYNILEQEDSDENITELITANEYTFREDGTIERL